MNYIFLFFINFNYNLRHFLLFLNSSYSAVYKFPNEHVHHVETKQFLFLFKKKKLCQLIVGGRILQNLCSINLVIFKIFSVRFSSKLHNVTTSNMLTEFSIVSLSFQKNNFTLKLLKLFENIRRISRILRMQRVNYRH